MKIINMKKSQSMVFAKSMLSLLSKYNIPVYRDMLSIHSKLVIHRCMVVVM